MHAVILWLRPTTQVPRGRPSLTAEMRRRVEKNRQKLVGRDKGSLTEQQTKGTGTTTIQIRGKHNTNRTTKRAAFLDRRTLPSRK